MQITHTLLVGWMSGLDFYGQYMRIYTTGELHGGGDGMKCEHSSGCAERSWSILLSDAENATLPEQLGHKAILFIFENKLGTVLCDDHMEMNKQI